MSSTAEHDSPRLTPRDMTFTALMAALLCALSQITIPLGPVPITLQTLAVALAGYTLGAKRGTLSVAVYIVLGACGLPVFSGFKGGLAHLIGPTGGYLVGFVFMAALCGLGKKRVFWQGLLAGFGGLLVVYIIGTVQLSLATGMTMKQAIMTGTAPFVLKDAASVACAALLARALIRRLPALA